MKKNRESSELAARLAVAASQPAGTGSVTAPALVSPGPVAQPVDNESALAQAATRSKAKKAKPKEPDTIPITIRPSSELLSKFVFKAAERTREKGRVVSAQQIMIEELERSIL